MNIAISSPERGGALYRFPPSARLWCAAPVLGLLGGCDGAPSRNILGSYFPSWMVCALVGLALALAARAIFKASGLLEELPVPFVVMLAIACAGVFAIDRRPRTHDARIFAYTAAMASEISGRIVQISVTNDQDVAKGAPLLVIDPVPYELQLRQARAQVAAIKAQIALTGRQVTSQGSGVQAAMSQVQKAREVLK